MENLWHNLRWDMSWDLAHLQLRWLLEHPDTLSENHYLMCTTSKYVGLRLRNSPEFRSFSPTSQIFPQNFSWFPLTTRRGAANGTKLGCCCSLALQHVVSSHADSNLWFQNYSCSYSSPINTPHYCLTVSFKVHTNQLLPVRYSPLVRYRDCLCPQPFWKYQDLGLHIWNQR